MTCAPHGRVSASYAGTLGCVQGAARVCLSLIAAFLRHCRYIFPAEKPADTRISTKITARRHEKILMHTCAEFVPLGSILHRTGVFCTRSLLYLSEGLRVFFFLYVVRVLL